MIPRPPSGPHFGPAVIGEEEYEEERKKYDKGKAVFGPAVTDQHFGPAVVDKPKTPAPSGDFDLHELNAKEAKKAIAAVTDPDDLDRLHAYERQHPKWTGGRVGVLDDIEERKGELTTPESSE